MVCFFTSSNMDTKKLTFSDQLSSARRKVVSGIGLWVIASFIVLSVVLFNVSVKAPFLNSVFQGFNSLGSRNSSSILSWPFSFSSSNNASSSSSFNGTSSSYSTTIAEKLDFPLVLNQTLNPNVSANGKDQNFTNGYGSGVDVENTHVGKFNNGVKNGSFSVKEGRVEDVSNVVKGSQIDKNASFVSASGKGMVLGSIGEGNLYNVVENGSSIVEGGMVKSEAVVKNAGGQNGNDKFLVNSNLTSDGVGNQVPEVGKIGNVTHNGENAESRDARKKVPDVNNGGILFEGNNSTISSNDSQFTMVSKTLYGECDIFHGRWVRDDTKPYYPPGSCPYVDRDFDCHFNGRPEDGYVKWKWQPYGCNIPSLNATDFLERLRGQKLVFVGDSLNRNMWESLVCILRHSVHDKKRVHEISGRTEFKKKGFYAFRFEDYNCSVDFVSSPFLVKELTHIGKNGSFETLRLDLMDQTTSMYHDADVIIFNTGHWWTHEKTSRGEDYYQEGNYVHPRLKVLKAYKRALATWARWVDKNIDANRTQVIFRGYSVTHFRGGPWNSGGQCHNETEPIMNDAYLAKYPSKMRAFEHVLHDMKTPVIYLNISRLTDYRKDAHPSIYRKEYKPAEQLVGDHVEDCSHWCLPGVPDTWNELLYASLLRTRRGSWRN